jgi:zinc/manganese transport system substrate-binding protein
MAVVVAGAASAACGAGRVQVASAPGGRISVVAAESFWGSIAEQLGGDRVQVTSVIHGPGVDPHDYEATPRDARRMAAAQYAIVNGAGYDPWTRDVLDANPADGRRVLDVGALVDVEDGANPHRWYFPSDVERVIAQIVADYQHIDPANRAYFEHQREQFESVALARYGALVAQIKDEFGGAPVGSSETFFDGIAEATGLDVRTPSDFRRAVSEGADPSAGDRATVDRQIRDHQIRVFAYNTQNATPDVAALVDEASAAGVPVVSFTESPSDGVAFQDWQAQQLQALLDALTRARGMAG